MTCADIPAVMRRRLSSATAGLTLRIVAIPRLSHVKSHINGPNFDLPKLSVRGLFRRVTDAIGASQIAANLLVDGNHVLRHAREERPSARGFRQLLHAGSAFIVGIGSNKVERDIALAYLLKSGLEI